MGLQAFSSHHTKRWYQRLRTGDHQNLSPKVFQMDSDPSTYRSDDWTQWIESIQVRRQYAAPGDHASHGVAERHIGILSTMALAMLHYCKRGKQFFFLAMRYACVIRNHIHTISTDSIPELSWTDKSLSHDQFKVFGCDAYARIDDRQSKLDFKSDKGIFVGIDTFSNGYLIYFPQLKRILVRVDVLFDER